MVFQNCKLAPEFPQKLVILAPNFVFLDKSCATQLIVMQYNSEL